MAIWCNIELCSMKDFCKTDSEKELNCDYYEKCLEDVYKCKEDGYPMAYGNKYCNKFLIFGITAAAN